MKNFWLDRKGPKKTKINIWLGASITEHSEQDVLLETVEVEIPKTEVICLRPGREGEKAVYDVTRFNPFSVISSETDNMLYHITARQLPSVRLANLSRYFRKLFMKQQWVAKLNNVEPPIEPYETYIGVTVAKNEEDILKHFRNTPEGGYGSLWGRLGKCYDLIFWASGGLYWGNDLKEQRKKVSLMVLRSSRCTSGNNWMSII